MTCRCGSSVCPQVEILITTRAAGPAPARGRLPAAGRAVAAEAEVVEGPVEDDLVTVPLDTTGEPLQRRGAQGLCRPQAPLRESMAAAFSLGDGGSNTHGGRFHVRRWNDRFWKRPDRPWAGAGRRGGCASRGLPAMPGTAGPESPGLTGACGDDRPLGNRRAATGAGSGRWSGEDEGAPRFFGFDGDDGAIRRSAARNASSRWWPAVPVARRREVTSPARGSRRIVRPTPRRDRERKLLFALRLLYVLRRLSG